jgi:hypothetical protein
LAIDNLQFEFPLLGVGDLFDAGAVECIWEELVLCFEEEGAGGHTFRPPDCAQFIGGDLLIDLAIDIDLEFLLLPEG